MAVSLLWIHFHYDKSNVQLHVWYSLKRRKLLYTFCSSHYSGTIIASKPSKNLRLTLMDWLWRKAVKTLHNVWCLSYKSHGQIPSEFSCRKPTSLLYTCTAIAARVRRVWEREKITSPLLLFYIMIFVQEFIITPVLTRKQRQQQQKANNKTIVNLRERNFYDVYRSGALLVRRFLLKKT